ncbi:MAG: adenylate/guanylate cyclase domain-containing protein [Thermodesulfobacteriota bacterium]|nr:adenylate/guanylate cyclase domain-containing protein [Thermodesulfobacteriota bacterium]
MLPNLIPHYSVGPSIGFIANAVMAILCLITLIPYHSYRPLRSLLLFYLLSTFFFLGWVVYGFQKSPQSIILGYRIDLAALALLPASWGWFNSSLSNDRHGWLYRLMIGISLLLAGLALLGQGPWLMGHPLVPHEIASGIMRPQSKVLRPLIHFFSLFVCLFYFLSTVLKLRRMKAERPTYLLPFGIGMAFWLLGGLHDALRSAGVSVPIEGQVLWFTSFWLSIFLTITVAIHFRSLELAVREARDVFEKFVPPAYLHRIATQGLGSIRLGQADQQWVTILFCDIRGFTALSEHLNPGQLVTLVNQLYEQIARVVNARQGVIDKFLGDAVLCIFEGADSAKRAVACGAGMLAAVRSFNAEKNDPVDQTIRIGIGLHYGPVILGTIGSTDRMDSTVLGLTVNLAKRLEELTKSMGVEMLISDQVADRLPDGHPYPLRSLGEVSVKGSSVPLAIYEVVG